MRILHVINSLNTGGAEKLIIDVLPKFANNGIDVDLAVLIDNNYDFMEVLRQKFKGAIYVLGNGSVYNPLLIIKIKNLIENYDLVHVHLFPSQYFVAIANVLNIKKTKLIFTEHSTSNRRIKNKLYTPIEKWVYNQYEKIICITPNVQDIVYKHTKLKKERLPVIMNGVDYLKYANAQPIERSNISPELEIGDQIIIQVSSMQYPKDHTTLLNALKILPSNFKAILVGNGVLRKDIEEYVNQLRLKNRVVFLGVRKDVPQLLKSSNFVVLSTKYEGLSLSSIEGMASGRPFIASDVPGITNVVEGFGRLFPFGDSDALANIILELSRDNILKEQLINKCQFRAKEFDITTMIDNHIALYKELHN